MAKAIPLAETSFVVVDLETTGSIPGKHAIMEIGAVKVRQGRIIERFHSLINPKQDIPPFIRDLTGIHPHMLKDAPGVRDVFSGFWDFLGDRIFVAHHVPFDFGFVNQVTKTLLGNELDNPQLCTCRLARKLLPGLRRKNLGSLAKHFNIPLPNHHRALDDAEATGLVLIEFLKILEEDGVRTLGKLMDYHQKGGKRYGNLKIPFPEHRVSEFPQTPGVYFMRDKRGDILYIGKSKNLRKRLQSYFSNPYRQPGKVQELMQQVYDIEVKVLGSELEALLEESRLIKAHQPYYNRQIKHYRSFPFLKVTVQDPFPELVATTQIDYDQALYFGPYKQKRRLSQMVDSLNKVFQLRSCTLATFRKHQKMQFPCMAYDIGSCSGPCADKIPPAAYREQVQDIVHFLEGRVSNLTQAMVAKRDAFADAMAFEKARHIQDRLLELLKLQANTQFLAQAVHQNHALIILPDRDPPRRLLLYVYKGRPFYRQVFDPREDSLDSITERVSLLQDMLAVTPEDKPEVVQQDELEEIRIISHWLRYREPDPQVILIDLTQPYEAVRNQIYRVFQIGSAYSSCVIEDFGATTEWAV